MGCAEVEGDGTVGHGSGERGEEVAHTEESPRAEVARSSHHRAKLRRRGVDACVEEADAVTVMHEGVGHEVRDRELQHHSGIDCGRKRERTRSERRAAFSGCDLTDTVEFEAESRGPGSRHDTVVEEEFVRVTEVEVVDESAHRLTLRPRHSTREATRRGTTRDRFSDKALRLRGSESLYSRGEHGLRGHDGQRVGQVTADTSLHGEFRLGEKSEKVERGSRLRERDPRGEQGQTLVQAGLCQETETTADERLEEEPRRAKGGSESWLSSRLETVRGASRSWKGVVGEGEARISATRARVRMPTT